LALSTAASQWSGLGKSWVQQKTPRPVCPGVALAAIVLETNPYGKRLWSAKSNNRSKFVEHMVMIPIQFCRPLLATKATNPPAKRLYRRIDGRSS
jgi:hypothetical protein